MMHEGKLTRGQLQAWALNRYYYQSRSRSRMRSSSRAVLIRVSAARGANASSIMTATGPAKAASSAGSNWPKRRDSSAEQVRAGEGILPATRFAVNEYLNIVRNR